MRAFEPCVAELHLALTLRHAQDVPDGGRFIQANASAATGDRGCRRHACHYSQARFEPKVDRRLLKMPVLFANALRTTRSTLDRPRSRASHLEEQI